MRRTRLAALALAVGALAAGLLVPATTGSAATAAAPARPALAGITWGQCNDPYLVQAGAKCGTLAVPLDPADPDGEKITLAVSRILADPGAGPYRGAMFTNPGGPGGSGLWVAALGAAVPGNVGRTYDWYGVDPRGVGDSRPALSCNGRYFGWDRPSYVPTKASITKHWRKKTERYARACGRSAGKKLLPHLRTTDVVADFEALRTAIGAEKVSFYGFSYGTYIAQVYATLHPDRLDKVVMDGVIDAKQVFYRSNLKQDKAFEKALTKFFGWVGRHHKTYQLGRSARAVRGEFERLKRRLDRRPAGGKVGPSELTDALLPAGYTVGAWPTVATAFSALANKGNASLVKQLYRSSNPVGKGADNGYAVYLGTECTDAPWPRKWRTWAKDNWRVHRSAPYLTWSNAWFNAPCRTWPVKAGPRVQVTRTFDRPVLLVSETFDGATPYAGALATRRLFKKAALVEGRNGTTHSSSLSGVACVDDTVAAYLRTGAVPARRTGNRSDKVCPKLAAPKPSSGKLALLDRLRLEAFR
ncbi:alpha/beta hydrolase [Nocardioides sp. SYSU D00038]|uniref:alpha/beta hydrolase n=1 Tax=Nocardioides sp. SYSU D00038 TaxID=2812554 RepID=UPI00196736BF|nr:alpha/beta hydrolase [Nocardioides sp. SYSU D00038]